MYRGGFIYIMTNKYRNVFYIGVTADLKKRIWEHKNHVYSTSFTKRYNMDALIYYEGFDTILDAIGREKQLKNWTRLKKDSLIVLKNPSLKDLYDEVMNDFYSLF